MKNIILIQTSPLDSIDTSRIAEIEKEVFHDAWGKRSIDSYLKDEFKVVLSATISTRTVGYLIGTRIAGEAEILRIATDVNARKLGIGSALMKAFIDICRGGNDCSIFLEVRSKNAPAISLYRAHGFSEYATRKNYYKSPDDDALMMRLDLDT